MHIHDLLRWDWVKRHDRYRLLCLSSPAIASAVRAFLSPDQLLQGLNTGVQPPEIMCIRPAKRMRETSATAECSCVRSARVCGLPRCVATARMGPWHGVFRVDHMIAFAELDDFLTDIFY